MLRHSPRAFVERLDFETSRGDHVQTVITDLAILEPRDGELTLVATHPGVAVEDVTAATGWDLRVADDVRETVPPTPDELTALRALRTKGQQLTADRRRARRSPGRSLLRPGGPGRLPRVPLDAVAGARPAARHAPGGVPPPRRPGVRRGRDRRARRRPHAPARGRAARRADHRLRPGARRRRPGDPERARRDLAGERRRALPPRGRPAPRAARPELLRCRPLPDRLGGQLALRHDQARRVPVGEPRQRLAAAAHPLLGVRAACSRSGSSRRCTSPATR